MRSHPQPAQQTGRQNQSGPRDSQLPVPRRARSCSSPINEPAPDNPARPTIPATPANGTQRTGPASSSPVGEPVYVALPENRQTSWRASAIPDIGWNVHRCSPGPSGRHPSPPRLPRRSPGTVLVGFDYPTRQLPADLVRACLAAGVVPSHRRLRPDRQLGVSPRRPARSGRPLCALMAAPRWLEKAGQGPKRREAPRLRHPGSPRTVDAPLEALRVARQRGTR